MEELARFVCGCWLLARSFLSFFSCFQFVRNFLRLSRLPLIAPCFQESRDDGQMDIFLSLVGFWYQIMNLYWIVSPPFGRIALRHAPWARKWTRKNTGFTYCDGVGWLHIESIFFNVWKELLNYSVLLLSISKVVVSMLVIMMSVFCQNNYLGVLATPLVILETGESLGTLGRWDMTHFQSTNSHLVDF